MPIERTGFCDLLDFRAQRFRHSFVGVDFEYPDATAGLDSRVPAIPFERPVTVDQTVGKTGRDFPRSVGTVVQQNNDLVREGERRETVSELFFLVSDRDYSGQYAWFCGHEASYSSKTG